MGRSVKVSYKKAGSSPSERQKRSQSLPGAHTRTASPLAPLARYLSENEDSGIPASELTEQFRELDCEHKVMNVLWENSRAKFSGCACCGKVIESVRPGAK